VCRRRGAKVEYKKCISEECTNLAQKGEVCKGSHGARGMGQRSNYAAEEDAETKSSKEESARGMEQSYFAAVKDARIKLTREECA